MLLSDPLILDIPIQSANSIRTGNFTPGHRNIRNMKGATTQKLSLFPPYETTESERLPYVDMTLYLLLTSDCFFAHALVSYIHRINWDFARLQKVATCRCLSLELRSVLNAVLF
jgi:hypothetical protein